MLCVIASGMAWGHPLQAFVFNLKYCLRRYTPRLLSKSKGLMLRFILGLVGLSETRTLCPREFITSCVSTLCYIDLRLVMLLKR